MYLAIRGSHDVIEARIYEGLKVLAAYVRVEMWCPRHRQRMHPIPVLELMRHVATVLPATARDDDVERAVTAPVAIAKLAQLELAHSPVDTSFALGELTSAAHAVRIKADPRTLIGDDAPSAVTHVGGRSGPQRLLTHADDALAGF